MHHIYTSAPPLCKPVTAAVKGSAPQSSMPIQAKAPGISTNALLERATRLGHNFGDAALSQQTAGLATTSLPSPVKASVEAFSGIAIDNVKVHYNSPQPEQLNVLAYTQGSDIHIGPGQEAQLPHEAWHVVQQAQGRVQPTLQIQDGVAVNTSDRLEQEADVMGKQISQRQNALMPPLPSMEGPRSNVIDIPHRSQPDVQTSEAISSPKVQPVLSSATNGVIQCAGKRKKSDQAHNFVAQPDAASYHQHVQDRAKHTIRTLRRVVRAQRTLAPGAKLASMFSKDAEVQVGEGVRVGKGAPQDLDAAHLMNTSFRPEVLLTGAVPTADQLNAVNELGAISGATTPQLKSNNVGSDKKIDRATTEFIQRHTKLVDSGVPLPDTKTLLNNFHGAVYGSLTDPKLNPKKRAKYQPAAQAIQEAMDNVDIHASDIDWDEDLWAKQYSFL